MGKIFYLTMILLSVVAAGCTTIDDSQHMVAETSTDQATRRFVSFSPLEKGMAREKVKSLLGQQVVIGYELADAQEQRYRPVVINNPYREEQHDQGKRSYVIDYYLTDIHQSDGTVSDDELVPLVFEQDRLIGWGWEFFNRLKQR